MDTIKLEKKWGVLNAPQVGKLATIRIDGSCEPDLNIGLNHAGNRCLVLYLKKPFKSKFIREEKENIKTSFDEKNHCIVLELLDNLYNQIFNDFTISLYNKIKDITDIAISTNTFISEINSWSSFLENKRKKGLTDDDIKGLFGEMKVLVDLITTNSYDINDILKGWTGPYDKHYDFCFDDVNIEVKTKNKDSNEVNISSSYQLDTELGKEMHLNVVSVNKGYDTGDNLENLFNEIKTLIITKSGDQSIFQNALLQKGLDNVTIKNYNHLKFIAIKSDIYDCNHINGTLHFPRIVDSLLPNTINKVKYTINLYELDSFIISKINY